MKKLKRRNSSPKEFVISSGRAIFIATLLFGLCTGCMEKCGSVFNKSPDARAYMAQKAVDDFFESIIEHKRDDAKYICNVAAIKVRFKILSEYHILETKFGDHGSKKELTNWFSYKVLTRFENAWGGNISNMYWVYVKLMPDESYKIFAILPETEAPFWEKVTKKISTSDPCGFPPN